MQPTTITLDIDPVLLAQAEQESILQGTTLHEHPADQPPERKSDADLARLIRNKPRVRLDTDANGNLFVDPVKHPRLYDWAVNG